VNFTRCGPECSSALSAVAHPLSVLQVLYTLLCPRQWLWMRGRGRWGREQRMMMVLLPCVIQIAVYFFSVMDRYSFCFIEMRDATPALWLTLGAFWMRRHLSAGASDYSLHSPHPHTPCSPTHTWARIPTPPPISDTTPTFTDSNTSGSSFPLAVDAVTEVCNLVTDSCVLARARALAVLPAVSLAGAWQCAC
jgi:hypothetical protein